MIVPLRWRGEFLEILDQRLLPETVTWISCRDHWEVARAIEELAVRGAPAIGLAAAYGVVLGVRQDVPLETVTNRLARTRPTAVNLTWALARMESAGVAFRQEGDSWKERLEVVAQGLESEDRAINQALGAWGATLLPEEGMVLTHCNAGALATGGHGTALGVLRSARDRGKRLRIFADETRPVLQGARLTAWELTEEGMDVTVICDGMASTLMAQYPVAAVIVGADRVAANGDVANKIGTYGLAVAASYHNVPFYVAAPRSTLDPRTPSGAHIPIEIRSEEEIRCCGGSRVVPAGAKVWNPAFDVTPAALVSALITEVGVFRPPLAGTVAAALAMPFDI